MADQGKPTIVVMVGLDDFLLAPEIEQINMIIGSLQEKYLVREHKFNLSSEAPCGTILGGNSKRIRVDYVIMKDTTGNYAYFVPEEASKVYKEIHSQIQQVAGDDLILG